MVDVHNRLVASIDDRLKESKINYDAIGKNVELYKGKRVIGEIDNFAVKGDTLLLFEIKSHYTPKQHYKAKKQLEKEAQFLKRNYKRIFKFEVHYRSFRNEIYRIRRIK